MGSKTLLQQNTSSLNWECQLSQVVLVTGARKLDHITPVLRELHWLPVSQRIRYKLEMTVYKWLHGLAPTYLADDCLAISAIAVTGILSVPGTRTTLGMRSFPVTDPFIWNSLPATLQTATLSPLTFAQHMFRLSTVRLRTIYDALYKSTHHHHHYDHKMAVVVETVVVPPYLHFSNSVLYKSKSKQMLLKCR